MTPATCRNCAAPLTGPYCSQCGQPVRDSLRSLSALLHEAWHIVTHFDGRFWSTMGLLLARPGRLTVEYFAERRARYVPPVRLYFVISVVFFGLASLTSHVNPAERLAEREQAAAAKLRAARAAAPAAATSDAEEAAVPDAGAGGSDFNFDLEDCAQVRISPHWLEQPLRAACLRNAADHGKTLLHAFIANVPRTMFVFLPLIALVMLLLYWRPRRYYVEHLVLVLHNHSALFLAMTLLMLLSVLARVVAPLAAPLRYGPLVLLLYAVWYVYRSMRCYYGQGRALTLAKLALVGLAYLACLVLTLLGTFVVSALTA